MNVFDCIFATCLDSEGLDLSILSRDVANLMVPETKSVFDMSALLFKCHLLRLSAASHIFLYSLLARTNCISEAP